MRNFCEELKENSFKRLTYTLYNKLDEENYISYLEKVLKEPLSIEDFEYYEFPFDDKERFSFKMRNKMMSNELKKLKTLCSSKFGIKLCVDYENGKIIVVKLKRVFLEKNGDNSL